MTDDYIRKTYFPLKKPCSTCPFRKDYGHTFGMSRERILEIANAVAFKCHKTFANPSGTRTKDDPQPQTEPTIQCHGLMTVLAREQRANQMMRHAIRMNIIDPEKFDPDKICYDTLEQAIMAHETQTPPD